MLIYPIVSLLILTSLASCIILYKRAKDKEEEQLRKQETKEKSGKEGKERKHKRERSSSGEQGGSPKKGKGA